IGVIPEANNYRIEEIEGVDHVVVDGYIWKTYSNEGYDLISESGEKGVSMEVSVEEGSKDKKTGIYKISKYSYLGVTVLGDDVMPAMGSTCKLETYSSNEEFQFAMNELNKEVEKYKMEVETMDNNIQEPVVDPVVEPTNQVEPTSTEPVVDPIEPEQHNFSLSIDNMSKSIRNTLYARKCKKKYSWSEREYEEPEFYLRTIIPSESVVILQDNTNDNYTHFGVNFTLNGDDITLDFDNKKEYIEVWRAKEQGEEVLVFSDRKETEDKVVTEQFSSMEAKISELQTEVDNKAQEVQELSQFKQQKDKEELVESVDSVIAQFSTSLDETEYKDAKDKALAGEITVDTLKFNLYALKGMKQEALEKEQLENFSAKGSKETEPVKVVVTSNILEPTVFSENTSARYGSLSADLARISAKNN
ncbi:MAG: hypothetical protein ACRCX8_00030, partial [Sarcina sp.]